MVKYIAIGNPLMGDDAIGIRVLRELASRLSGEEVEIIYGETDVEYVLDNIQDGDFLFVLDAVDTGREPGSVIVMPIQASGGMLSQPFSQHQPGILWYLTAYRIDVTGYVIGIEAAEISFGTDLSEQLKDRFFIICEAAFAVMNWIIYVENNQVMSYTVEKKP